jgi:hypothetical protein
VREGNVDNRVDIAEKLGEAVSIVMSRVVFEDPRMHHLAALPDAHRVSGKAFGVGYHPLALLGDLRRIVRAVKMHDRWFAQIEHIDAELTIGHFHRMQAVANGGEHRVYVVGASHGPDRAVQLLQGQLFGGLVFAFADVAGDAVRAQVGFVLVDTAGAQRAMADIHIHVAGDPAARPQPDL